MSKFVTFTNIVINFPPNYALGLGFIICAILSFFVVLQLFIPLVGKIILLVSLFIYTRYIYQRDVNRTIPAAWISCKKIAHHQWLLQNCQGMFYVGKLRNDSFVSSWLIILRWELHVPAARRLLPRIASVPVFKWMLPAENWRQLCMSLRWQPVEKISKC